MHFGESDTSASMAPLRRQMIGCRLLLPTLGILVLTAGVGLALISYLMANKMSRQTLHDVVFITGWLYADEGVRDLPDGHQEANLRGLLLTSLAVSHLFCFPLRIQLTHDKFTMFV
jgi:hypothetical protein